MLHRSLPLYGIAFAAAAALLAGCGGSGTGSQSAMPPSMNARDLVAQAAATPMPSTLSLAQGKVIGTDNAFSPTDGDTSTGGLGQTVDGIACAPSMTENKYHVHLYVGLLVNGVQYAIPDGVGMDVPGADVNGFVNTAKCFYSIHTHDASGMIHIESASSALLSSAIYNFGNLLDVWGQTVSSTNFGRFSGTVHVFYATTPLRSTYSGTYKAYTGNPRAIGLYSHEAIWIEVGNTYRTAAELPRIRFYTEY